MPTLAEVVDRRGWAVSGECEHGTRGALCGLLPRGGAADEAVDELGELGAGVTGGLGEQALRGEAGERVDFQHVGLLGLLVYHDVDAGEVTGADDGVAPLGEALALLDEVGAQA